ncbi:helix-turn-helix transcriptional regulator [Microvirga sp. RSM25]|uniref:helix-turn-helix transcriptional regulator n=1 Tax=Microvirga sp. RSM25 TaxID=3273802 RepID=UPI00384C268F
MSAKTASPTAQNGNPRKLVSRKQLAERLGVSERTIMRLEESGYLPPPVRVGQRRVGHWEDTVPRQPNGHSL